MSEQVALFGYQKTDYRNIYCSQTKMNIKPGKNQYVGDETNCVGPEQINHLKPNGHFSGRTAQLIYRCCIFYLFNRYTYRIF